MADIPEFLLRKLFVKDSLKPVSDGFCFQLKNTFAPATVTAFELKISGKTIPPEKLELSLQGEPPRLAETISTDKPFSLPVNVNLEVIVKGSPVPLDEVHFFVDTVEAGALNFSIKPGLASGAASPSRIPSRINLLDLITGRLRAVARIDAEKTIGEINPFVYGHFIEHLEDCIYGGIWTADGSKMRDDTLSLIQALKPSIIRYPGGNFASGYHWEDGIGPRESRPKRFDAAWQSWESNQIGTDEFIQFCRRVGAEPYLAVNDGSGTAEEAARWLAYCNAATNTEQGQRRAANGHPDPYHVRYWGIGNEVWGRWQIGHTTAEDYAKRLAEIANAMREVDSNIRVIGVGDTILSDSYDDPGLRWNDTVLRSAADHIQFLSFHLYQPGQEGWQETYQPDQLFRTVTAAPLTAEKMIQRMAGLIQRAAPGKGIKIALDEWNLWLTPPEGAASMHKVRFTLRDALYCAGMLNVFQRNSRSLAMANLAQMVNVLPLIVTSPYQAYLTPMALPFMMYRQMEPVALEVEMETKTYKSEPLGNIEAIEKVPYVDVSATRSRGGRRVVLSVVNRHPTKRLDLSIRLYGFGDLRPKTGWLLSHSDPLADNSFEKPDHVKIKEVELKNIGHKTRFTLDLPASSVSVISLEE